MIYLHLPVRGGEGPGERQHPADLRLQLLLAALDALGGPALPHDELVRARPQQVQPPPRLVQRRALPHRLLPRLQH
jgi:hypothetical protein